MSAAFFPGCFFFGCFQFQVLRFRCIQVADCLCFIKEYDSPSTSAKRICSESAIFRWICQNGFFWKRTICSIISCILSFKACVCLDNSSICPTIPRKALSADPYQTYSVVLFVYLIVITGTPVFILIPIITEFLYFPPILPDGLSVIMTLDNTSGKPLFYSFFRCIIHTTQFYSHDNKWNEKRLFVDNLFIRLIHSCFTVLVLF